MPDWFSQNAPRPPQVGGGGGGSGDWFEQNSPIRVAPPPVPPGLQGPPEPSAWSRFGSSLLDQINPLPAFEEAYRVGTSGTPEEYRSYQLKQLMGGIPLIGEGQIAATAGKQALAGDLAGAGGTLVGGYGPQLLGDLPFTKTGSVLGGAAKGAARASIKPIPHGMLHLPLPAPIVGAASAKLAISHLFGPEAGDLAAVAGGVAPIIKGAWQGGKAGAAKFDAAKAAATKIQPVETVSKPTPEVRGPGPVLSPTEQAVPKHATIRGVSDAVNNKVANIHDYLATNGIRAETLDAMTPEQLKMVADAAYEHGKSKGSVVPKSGYKGLEGDTLEMVKSRLRGK